MKKVQKSMLDKLASVSKFAAVKAAGTTSCVRFHQPKEPQAVTNSTAPGEYSLWVRQC